MTKKIRGASYTRVKVNPGRIHKNGRHTPISHAERKEAWNTVRELIEEVQQERVKTYADMKEDIKTRKRQDNWINACVLGGAFLLTAAIVIIIVIVGTL